MKKKLKKQYLPTPKKMNLKFIFLIAPISIIFLYVFFTFVLVFFNTYAVLSLKTFFSLLLEEVNFQPKVLTFYFTRLQTLTWRVSFISIFFATFIQVLTLTHNNYYPQVSFSFVAMLLFNRRFDLTAYAYNEIITGYGRSLNKGSSIDSYIQQYYLDSENLNNIYIAYLEVVPSNSNFYPMLLLFVLTLVVTYLTYSSITHSGRSKIILAANIDFEVKLFFPILLFSIYLGVNFFFKTYVVGWLLFYFNKLDLPKKIKFLHGLYYLILVNFILNLLVLVGFVYSLYYFGVIAPVTASNLTDISQSLLNLIEDLTQAITQLRSTLEVGSPKYQHLTDLLDQLQTLKKSQTHLQRVTDLEFGSQVFFFPYQYFTLFRQILLFFFGLSWVLLYVYVSHNKS